MLSDKQRIRMLRLALRVAHLRMRHLKRKLAVATNSRPHPYHSRAMRMADAVASVYGITRDTLLARRRHKTIAEARKVLYYVCRTVPNPPWSYPEIGMALEGRDHTTIMSGVRNVQLRMRTDKEFLLLVLHARNAARRAGYGENRY